MRKRQTFLTSVFWVFFFSGFGLICIFGFWPWLNELGFLIAGILLNVFAFIYWLKIVRKQSTQDADKF